MHDMSEIAGELDHLFCGIVTCVQFHRANGTITQLVVNRKSQQKLPVDIQSKLLSHCHVLLFLLGNFGLEIYLRPVQIDVVSPM